MTNLDKFDHIVVLMLENRSFDTMLGYLYENDAPKNFIGTNAPFDGVAGEELSNPAPNGAPPVRVQKAPYATQREMCNPFPDPGEEYAPHVNTQLYGTPSPSAADLAAPPSMSGFVLDYAAEIVRQSESKVPPSESDYRLVMDCFPPEAVPVISSLARSYAVSDRWFCSVPSQTFCNRSFIGSAQSRGFVTNSLQVKWVENTAPTIFNRLSDAKLRWRIYYDGEDVVSATRALHPALYLPEHEDNFRHFAAFHADCAAGTLPEYTFIEPRLFINHNDQHPPSALNMLQDSSVLAGELLIRDVYAAICSNEQLRQRTLLVILYDEHGGTYDHVPPPTGATPPHAAPPYELESGFEFDRFGVRVPAVFISPYIEEGTVVRAGADGGTPFDHTSIIRTICEKWNLPPLTERDNAAPSLAPLLTRTTPRPAPPMVTPRPYSPTDADIARQFPISPRQEGVLGLITNALDTDLPADVKNIGDALAHLTTARQSGFRKII
jgi:phospholipase C